MCSPREPNRPLEMAAKAHPHPLYIFLTTESYFLYACLQEKEAKKEAFRKYLESSRVLDAFTKGSNLMAGILKTVAHNKNHPKLSRKHVEKESTLVDASSSGDVARLKAAMKINKGEMTHEFL
uniref:Uncharacterized protein n=1 Tax=Lactuca sativa TaxID=4236 RepID=A0A9R1XPR0_LACSA|nr:hypothetical protein LSAT_V11C200058310 [Lactuca sativa]